MTFMSIDRSKLWFDLYFPLFKDYGKTSGTKKNTNQTTSSLLKSFMYKMKRRFVVTMNIAQCMYNVLGTLDVKQWLRFVS